MPRFFFDVTTGDRFDRDMEGTELPNAVTARSEAVQCFGEMIRSASAAAPERWGIDVRDETGRAIATASFRMTVEEDR